MVTKHVKNVKCIDEKSRNVILLVCKKKKSFCEKGKPVEKRGRKAMDLRYSTRIAGCHTSTCYMSKTRLQ